MSLASTPSCYSEFPKTLYIVCKNTWLCSFLTLGSARSSLTSTFVVLGVLNNYFLLLADLLHTITNARHVKALSFSLMSFLSWTCCLIMRLCACGLLYLHALQQDAASMHSEQSWGLSGRQGEETEQSLFFPQHFQLSQLVKTAKLGILLLHWLAIWPVMKCLGSFLCVKNPPEMADEWDQSASVLLWQQWSNQRCWQHWWTEACREDAVPE